MAGISPNVNINPLKIFFSRTRRHLECSSYLMYLNDDPSLTLTFFMSKSNVLPNAKYMGRNLGEDGKKCLTTFEAKGINNTRYFNKMRQCLKISPKG